MTQPPLITDIEESITDLSGSSRGETVLKEIIDSKKLPFITELTFEQVVEICKLKHIAVKYGKKNFPKLNKIFPIEDTINNFIENFTLYMTSHKRKRVEEFLEGLKSERQIREHQPNFISKFLNR